MKYVVVLCDGMADWKIEALGGKTCLEAASTPTLDSLAPRCEIGMCKTVPDGMKPGSDVANMSVLGFDPRVSYTGRSPLEAVSMGIDLGPSDVTYRCNLVTLSPDEPYGEKTMVDYSSGEISSEEAKELIEYLKPYMDDETFTLYPGVSYRHCMVAKGIATGCDLTPPHDISDKKVGQYLPKGENSERLLGMMRKSYDLLKDHPVNKKRISEGKNPANSMWFWGEGTRARLENFEKSRGLRGGVISAVDLVRGIGLTAGMETIDVPGATGNWDTNFLGKAEAAADALINGLDYVYVHMEATDECGHHGDWEHKVYSIEQIDNLVVKTLCDRLTEAGEDFCMLVCPDHPTPCACKTHISDPVPYLIYTNKENLGNGAARYTEDEGEKTGVYRESGPALAERFLSIK